MQGIRRAENCKLDCQFSQPGINLANCWLTASYQVPGSRMRNRDRISNWYRYACNHTSNQSNFVHLQRRAFPPKFFQHVHFFPALASFNFNQGNNNNNWSPISLHICVFFWYRRNLIQNLRFLPLLPPGLLADVWPLEESFSDRNELLYLCIYVEN